MRRAELLPGTLDLLILKAVSLRAEHGYGVLLRIEQITGGALLVEQGALYPALYRLEEQGLLDTEWGTSDNNRKAKFYSLTAAGRKRLKAETERWTVSAGAVNAALQSTGGVTCAGFAPSGAGCSVAATSSDRWPTSCRFTSTPARPISCPASACPGPKPSVGHASSSARSKNTRKRAGRASGLRLIDDFRGDLRFAHRALIKNIGFSAAAIGILAIGIGANTAVFSVVDAMFLGTLPVKNPQDLVAFDTLQQRDSMVASYSGSGRPGPGGTSRRTSFSMLTFERFRDHATTLSHVFAFASLGSVTVATDDSAEIASAQVVSGTYFDGLGVPAALGRTLGPSDDRPDAEPAAVVSHRYWQRRFLGDTAIIGKTIRVNRTTFTIVGVTPETFHGTELTETVDLSLPLAMSDRLSPTRQPRSVASWWLLVMGRLKPGVTREQVLHRAPADLQRDRRHELGRSRAGNTRPGAERDADHACHVRESGSGRSFADGAKQSHHSCSPSRESCCSLRASTWPACCWCEPRTGVRK